jgi:hypothetical protein
MSAIVTGFGNDKYEQPWKREHAALVTSSNKTNVRQNAVVAFTKYNRS